jgi:hypothetical protein
VLPFSKEALNGLEFLRSAGYDCFNIRDRGPIGHRQFAVSQFQGWPLVPKRSLLKDTEWPATVAGRKGNVCQ